MGQLQPILYQINTLEIVQDSRNRWYACITVKDYPKQSCGTGSVGIDLGLKDSATASNGDKLTIKQTLKYAKTISYSPTLKTKTCQGYPCQNQKHKARPIHKFTTQLVKDNALIVVGDVQKPPNLTVKRQTRQIGLMQVGLNLNDNWPTNARTQVAVLKSWMRNTLPKLARVAAKCPQ